MVRLFPSRFERAYILLYNDRIPAGCFAAEAGIKDKAEAWRRLCEYRQRVIDGEIQDPREKYRLHR